MTGILLIDKSPGWTSHDAVAKMRGVLRERRIGHSGTLDPMATGLLVLLTGRATRGASFAEAQEKRYIAGLRLGITTDTQDITGRVLEEHQVNITQEQLANSLKQFRGEIKQIPPMYSAIKIDGQRLYKLARKGAEVERKPREVNITNLQLLGCEDGDYMLDISCSKGTYIRSLCHDIGEALGCGGVMSSLRRTHCGSFSVDRACTVDQVLEAAERGEAENLLLPLDMLFSETPKVTATAGEEARIRNGAKYKTVLRDGEYRVYSSGGEFLMLGKAERGAMGALKSFYEV